MGTLQKMVILDPKRKFFEPVSMSFIDIFFKCSFVYWAY